MKIGIVKVKNRNASISIGALLIIDELQRQNYTPEICTYQSAHKYTHVLVSMTATDDIFDIYKECKKNKWNKRTFKAFVGGFGCQNPLALDDFIDYAFFGRVDNIISDYLLNPEKYSNHSFKLKTPHKVTLRQVDVCYPFSLKYGKNNTGWVEKFIGCPFRCKFCHYSHNRKYVGDGGYLNEGLSTGSPELMLKDIHKIEKKLGRLTAALDGYSERLRFMFGKKITWDMVEEALDHLLSFKGNIYFKMYNVCNFPTETEIDVQEFNEFWNDYVGCTTKGDGVLKVDVFNTAFRPSINTPMERMPAKLFPEARRENYDIASNDSISIKYTHLTKGWKEHLKDLVSIRYTDKGVIEKISLYNEFDFDYSDYLREYKENEVLPFWFLK